MMLTAERKNSHTLIAVAFVLSVIWAITHVETIWLTWGQLSDFTGWLPYPPQL